MGGPFSNLLINSKFYTLCSLYARYMYLFLLICLCLQLSFISRLVSFVFMHSFAFVPYASGSSFLFHYTQAILIIHVHAWLRGTIVELEVSLAFLARVFCVSIEVIFQIVKASKLLVAVLAGKRLLPFVNVQVSLVSCEIVEFFFTSITFIWTVTYKDIQTVQLFQPPSLHSLQQCCYSATRYHFH